jgi:hypothetical protein
MVFLMNSISISKEKTDFNWFWCENYLNWRWTVIIHFPLLLFQCELVIICQILITRTNICKKIFESLEQIYLIHIFSFVFIKCINDLRRTYLVVLLMYNKRSECRSPSLYLWTHQAKRVVLLNPICMREALV